MFLCSLVSPATAQFTAITRQAQLWRSLNEPAELIVLRGKDRFICEPGVPWTRTRPLRIHCDEKDPPEAAIVLARNAKGDSVHGSVLINITVTGRCKSAVPIINLGHEGVLMINVIVDMSTPETGGAETAGIAFSSVDLWNLGVPAGFTCTGATLINCHVYNWWGGDSCDVLFAGEVTDIDWYGFQSSGKGLARVRAHSVPRYQWTNGKGWSDGIPKRIHFSHAGMAEGAFAHNFVRTRDAAQPQYAQDITFTGVNWQPHDIPPVVAPPGGGNTGGGPSGGGTDEPDGPPPPPPTSLMPIGIPEPQWSLWKSAEDGFVAPPANMWVDNTNANATDAGNPRGTLDRPRRTIPYRLNAGDVLEIRGGPYTGNNLELLATGTEQHPIIVRGVGLPRIEFKVSLFSRDFASSWVRFENLDLKKWEVIDTNHHVVLRDSLVRNGGGINIGGSQARGPAAQIVIDDCIIADNGNWLAEFDEDIHGISVGGFTEWLWILDSEIYHCSGDGVQGYAGSAANLASLTRVFIGRCKIHHNKQTAVAPKQSFLLVVSESEIHDFKPIGASPSAWGAGLAGQYGPEGVWYIFNHIYNASFGIGTGSSNCGDPNGGCGENVYYIGNVIHDIRHEADRAFNPGTTWGNAALSLIGGPNKHVIGNTIVRADGGIYFNGGKRLLAEGNLLIDVAATHTTRDPVTGVITTRTLTQPDIWLEDPAGATLEVYSNLACPTAEFRIANQPQSWPIGNLVGDPMFVGQVSNLSSVWRVSNPPAVGQVFNLSDFKPSPGSPAIAAWTPSISARSVFQRYRDTFGVSIECDAAGKPRPASGAWTIGALQP